MRYTRVKSTALILALIGSLLTGLAVQAREPQMPRPKDRWNQVQTANFTIFSNAAEKMTRRAGANLEQLRAVLQTLFGGMNFLSPVPTYIFVFDHPKSFAPYTLYYEGKPQDRLGGYFGSGEFANHVAIVSNQYSTDVSAIIYHEYLHFVVNTNLPGLPLWLNEGLAEFYSSFDVEDGIAKIGYPVGRHLAWLHVHTLIPMETFVAIDHDSPEYHEGNRRGSFYAQSWALTHFLVIGQPDGHAKIGRYTELLREGVDPDAAFLTAFDTTYGKLERDLNHYIGSRKFTYVTLPVAGTAAGSSTVTSMAYPEVLSRLGDLLTSLGSERFDSASEHFLTALQIDPTHGPAIAGLGRIDELSNRTEQALLRYRQAAELGPDDFMTQFLFGNLLWQKMEGAETAEAKQAARQEAQSALNRAVALRPSFGEAWSILGKTYFNTDDPDGSGLEALEHAHRLLPKRGDVGYNLTALYTSLGRSEEATAVINRMRAAGVESSAVTAAQKLLSTATAATATLAAEAPTEAELLPRTDRTPGFTERYNEAAQMVNAGDLQAAAAALEVLLEDDLTDREVKTTADLLGQVRGFSQLQSRADEAMKLANSGDIEAAIAILEPLLRTAPDQAQTTEVRQMLDKLYGYRDFQATYNRAAELFNTGKFDEAAALLGPLAERAPTSRLRSMASTLLREIREMK